MKRAACLRIDACLVCYLLEWTLFFCFHLFSTQEVAAATNLHEQAKQKAKPGKTRPIKGQATSHQDQSNESRQSSIAICIAAIAIIVVVKPQGQAGKSDV